MESMETSVAAPQMILTCLSNNEKNQKLSEQNAPPSLLQASDEIRPLYGINKIGIPYLTEPIKLLYVRTPDQYMGY